MFLCSIKKEMFAVAESYCGSPPSAKDFATVLHACRRGAIDNALAFKKFFLVVLFLFFLTYFHFFNRLKLNCKSIISFHF